MRTLGSSFLLFISLTLNAIEPSVSTEFESNSFSGDFESIQPSPCSFIEGEGVVEGVNVVTGKYLDHHIDFVTHGPDPLVVERYYSRSRSNGMTYVNYDAPNCLGWYLNFDNFFYLDKSKENIALADRTGAFILFHKSPKDGSFCIPEQDGFKGFMNHTSGEINGQRHLINAYLQPNPQEGFELYLGDGSIRHFGNKEIADKLTFQLTADWERKPSGNTVIYKDNEIKTVANDGKTVINWVRFDWQKEKTVVVQTSDGKSLQYVPISNPYRFRGSLVRLLDHVVLPDGNQIKYHYDCRLSQGADFFEGKDLPGGGYVRLSYNAGKVAEIKTPAGVDHNPVITRTFTYGDNCTEVHDANHNCTTYFYNQDGRITRIDRPSGARENNVWSSQGCLLCKTLFDENNQAIIARTFSYDERGNVVTEQIYGNLTGKCNTSLVIDAQGLPIENGSECYTKHYSYSTDGKNLLLSESDGLSRTCYSYKRNTNLLASKLIYDQTKLRRRQFRTYDACGSLTSLIEDDGSSPYADNLTDCSFRKITTLANRMGAPAVGQPEVIEEKYFDFKTRQEKMLKRTLLSYNSNHECVQEDVFDDSGTYCYSIQRGYDVMGRRTFETDPLGNAIQWTYDAAGNVVQKQGPRPDAIETYSYDFLNRLIVAKEEGQDASRTVRYRYDAVGNQIAKMDEGGNETLYDYDGANRLTRITYPPVLNDKGEFYRAFETKRYDAADNMIEWINPRGDRLVTEYNVRGQPIRIQITAKEGDILEEAFEYDLRGNCVRKVAPNGLATLFTYDFLDRLEKTTQLAQAGAVLAETVANYNAFFLTSLVDAEGKTTRFSYDYAGHERLVEKEISKAQTTRTEKSYNSFGNLIEVKDWFCNLPNDYTLKRMTYDWMGRVIEERNEDATGRVYEKRSYVYDPAGNETHLIEWAADGKEAITTRCYDALGRKITEQDSTGYYLKTEYLEAASSSRNQAGTYKKEIDPAGNYTETFYDALLRPEMIVKKDSEGTPLVLQKMYYDEVGNLVLLREALQADDPQTKWAATRFAYTYNGKQTEIVEDAESSSPRKTRYFYEKGELVRKQTPLGSVYFAYNALGRLVQQKAASQKGVPAIETAYKYDRKGRVIEAKENKQITTRTYDGLGNLIYEKQSSGLTIAYTYDRQGRRTKMQLPDETGIEYSYQGPQLYQVQRIGKKERLLYTHTYVQRDLSGKIKSIKLAGKAGGISFNYDLAGRLQSINSPLWNQRAAFDEQGHLYELSTEQGVLQRKASFSYDALGRLIAENGVVKKTYKYDSLDNRLDGEIGDLNQLIKAMGCTFGWDAEGRLTSCKGIKDCKCTYDALGRMSSYNKTSYSYDAFGRRIGKNREWFLYDGANEMGIFDKKGKCTEMRILGEGLGGERGATLSVELNNKVYAIFHDVRGNIGVLVDINTGQIFEEYDYSAFGQIACFDHLQHKSSVSWMGNAWGWNGKRADKESKWVFFGKRHYFPEIGRWTTPDPLGFVDGSNRYEYVHQNPLTHADYFGEYDVFRPFRRDRSHEYMGRINYRLNGMMAWIGKDMIPMPEPSDCLGRWGAGGKLLRACHHAKEMQQPANLAGELAFDLEENQTLKNGSFSLVSRSKRTTDKGENYNFSLNEPFCSRSALTPR